MLDRNEVMELIARIEKLCETLELEYHDYDDPDRLFDDIKAKAEKLS